MKKRNSKNYIIIGTAHLGLDTRVLKAMANAARYYNAEVIHVGPLATHTEIQMYERRKRKLRTWEQNDKEKLKNKSQQIKDEIRVLQEEAKEHKKGINKKANKERQKASEYIDKLNKKIKKLSEDDKLLWGRMSDDHQRLENERKELIEIQNRRIQTLRDVFGKNISFVSNEELMIGDGMDYLGDHYVDKNLKLGKHLLITSVPANGDKVAGQPITKRTFRMLKNMGHSHIIPHMTPQVRPFPRSGLNQAYNFITTGALHITGYPHRTTEAYKTSSRASCVLVSVDQENGEFHPQRLRVKLIRKGTAKQAAPHIIHDGLVFDGNGGVTELPKPDKAVHVTDMHARFEHLGVVSAIRALNELHQPQTFIDGGDTGDYSSVSRHTEGVPGERENLRLKDDLTGVRRLLDAMTSGCKSIKDKVLLDSNHAEWITAFVERHPQLKGLLDWPSLAKTWFSDWNVFIREAGEDKSFKFGDLDIKHGDNESTDAAYDTYGNYLGGHDHRYQEIGDAIKTGPGCRLGPKFLQNRATSWQNQITSISKFKGKTCKHPRIVLHTEKKQLSRFAYRGQIYEVKYHEYKE